MSNKMLLRECFNTLLETITPESLLLNACQLEGDMFYVQDASYDLRAYKKIHLLGSGKAVVPMAQAIQKILQSYAPKSLLVGAYPLKDTLEDTTYIQSTHPLPSDQSIEAAKALEASMLAMDEEDLYIYLLSGGSSALIELPVEGLTLDAIEKTTRVMLHGGVPIEAMNSVRKALSQIKGGKLAQKSKATGIVLVLSDVLGNDYSAIGSAPLYGMNTKGLSPISVLQEYGLEDQVPTEVLAFLSQIQEQPSRLEKKEVRHFLIGSNEVVLDQAEIILRERKILPERIDFQINGDAKQMAQKLYEHALKDTQKRHCYIAGGEATVVVRGKGKGGRNQHLALHILDLLDGNHDITFLSGATDGVDGNSSAAGAVVDWHTRAEAIAHGISVSHYLEYFDSNTFFTQLDGLLMSGPTHNNLLDIVMILVEPKLPQGDLHG